MHYLRQYGTVLAFGRKIVLGGGSCRRRGVSPYLTVLRHQKSRKIIKYLSLIALGSCTSFVTVVREKCIILQMHQCLPNYKNSITLVNSSAKKKHNKTGVINDPLGQTHGEIVGLPSGSLMTHIMFTIYVRT